VKIAELFEDDEDLTPLKNLSKHVYHGRVWCGEREADAILEAAHKAADDDVLVWHDWLNDTVYEITIAAKTKAEVMRVLEASAKATPRPSHTFWCYKAAGEIIEHSDWHSTSF
jgi:hypothetical protein